MVVYVFPANHVCFYVNLQPILFQYLFQCFPEFCRKLYRILKNIKIVGNIGMKLIKCYRYEILTGTQKF